MFEQQDYILRIIGLWGQALRRALESLRLGRGGDALEYSEQAIGLALDTDPSLVLRLTPEGLVAYLGIGGAIDVRRVKMLADALDARADALDALSREQEADLDRRRAGAIREAAGLDGTEVLVGMSEADAMFAERAGEAGEASDDA